MPVDPAHEIASAISRACPDLRPVAVPRAGVFASPILGPELYPDIKDTRGYYVPVPPPPPFKVPGAGLPVLVGYSKGRQWRVTVVSSEFGARPIPPCLTVSTYVRLLRTDLQPYSVVPWVTVSPELPEEPPVRRAGPPGIDFGRLAARTAVGHAALFRGRRPTAVVRPPIQAPLVVEAWDPLAQAYFTTDEFLGAYANWSRGSRSAEGAPSMPVLHLLADQFHFSIGVDLTDARLPAEIVRTLVDLVPDLEQRCTGRDAEVDPIPVVTFREPAGSVPDSRPAYRCPKCGQMEILRRVRDREAGSTRVCTLGCGVDIFPAYPDQPSRVLGTRP